MKPAALLRLALRHANRLPESTGARLGRTLCPLGHRLGARRGLHHVSLHLRVLELFLQHAVLERARHGRQGGVWLGDGVSAGERPSAALGRRGGVDAGRDVA